MFPSINLTSLGITPVKKRTVCALCGGAKQLAHMTAGSQYADGSQAFACQTHTWPLAHWSVAWARFEIAERRKKESKELGLEAALKDNYLYDAFTR